jgi:tRNA pseudouridine55 synthase
MMEQVSPDEGRVLLIDKPYEWTSFDVVNKLRYKLKIKKIGHAGTLDPLATGLLIICVGKMTKRIEEFMGMEKEYTGTFTLGQTTASHDLETEPGEQQSLDLLTDQIIHDAVNPFIGNISQIPPLHSAILIGGKRAYSFARKGQEVELQPRQVSVSVFEITHIHLPLVHFRIVCSKGTYIRSLARDYGKELGVGAFLSSLRRTRIGQFKVEDAQKIEDVA